MLSIHPVSQVRDAVESLYKGIHRVFPREGSGLVHPLSPTSKFSLECLYHDVRYLATGKKRSTNTGSSRTQ